MQHKLSDAIVTKEAIQTIEFDLQRLMTERKDAETNNSDSDHIQYLNERIEEAQTQLCDLEGSFSGTHYVIKLFIYRRRCNLATR